MVRRMRLDTELVRRGLARSREQAADLIAAGRVAVGGQAAGKAATQVGQDAAITVAEARPGGDYASRGGRNLAPAVMGPRHLADVVLPPFEMVQPWATPPVTAVFPGTAIDW